MFLSDPLNLFANESKTYGSSVPDSGRYAPPEVAKGGWDSIKRGPVSAVDAYDFGILITEVFNGGFSGSDQISQTKSIPVDVSAHYKRLVSANPKTRLSVAHFMEQGKRGGSFFDTPLIQLSDGIDNLGLKTETEREEFFKYVLINSNMSSLADTIVVSSMLSPKPMTSLKTSSRSRSCQSFSSLPSSAVEAQESSA